MVGDLKQGVIVNPTSPGGHFVYFVCGRSGSFLEVLVPGGIVTG